MKSLLAAFSFIFLAFSFSAHSQTVTCSNADGSWKYFLHTYEGGAAPRAGMEAAVLTLWLDGQEISKDVSLFGDHGSIESTQLGPIASNLGKRTDLDTTRAQDKPTGVILYSQQISFSRRDGTPHPQWGMRADELLICRDVFPTVPRP